MTEEDEYEEIEDEEHHGIRCEVTLEDPDAASQELNQRIEKLHNIERTGEILEVEEPSATWEELMNKDILLLRLKRGGGDFASMGTIVTCDLLGYLLNTEMPSLALADAPDPSLTSTPFERLTSQRFKIGEGDTVPALELALRHSRVGDLFRVRFTCKYGYGDSERPAVKEADGTVVPAIPARASLEYEVKVTAHFDPLTEGIPLPAPTTAEDVAISVPDPLHNPAAIRNRESAIFEASLRKECGNRWFSYNEWQRAARAYGKGAEAAEGYLKSAQESKGDEGEEGEEGMILGEVDPNGRVMEAYVACLNNLAACHLTTGEYTKAKEIATRVIEVSPNNVKALLRAARSSLALHLFEEAGACLKAVLELEPENPSARREAARLKQAVKEYKEQSKAMAKRMALASSSSSTAPISTTVTKPASTSDKGPVPSPVEPPGANLPQSSIIRSGNEDLKNCETSPAQESIVQDVNISIPSRIPSSTASVKPTSSASLKQSPAPSTSIKTTEAGDKASTATAEKAKVSIASKSAPETTKLLDTNSSNTIPTSSVRREWPLFLMLLTSAVVVLLSLAAAYFLGTEAG